ncbi:MAG: hypothetical protein Q8R28_15085 [Dehalococcoidia bacterium]|nr:hypothetical protein [Dehalococcoidia bacterium]
MMKWVCSWCSRKYTVDMLLQGMHTFAHEVGRAGIKLRGNRRAGDNPVGVVY